MAARFPTTRWSRVIRAGDPADPRGRAALEELCRDYWFPLYAFVRRHGFSAEEAEDIVQGFLADLLERGDLATLDQSKGRFRSFLRAACEHFLANRRDHDRAAKRGGGITIVSINRLDAESRYDREPAHELTAERLFQRQWALTLVGRVLERLEAEPVQAGKAQFSAVSARWYRVTTWHHRMPPSAQSWGNRALNQSHSSASRRRQGHRQTAPERNRRGQRPRRRRQVMKDYHINILHSQEGDGYNADIPDLHYLLGLWQHAAGGTHGARKS